MDKFVRPAKQHVIRVLRQFPKTMTPTALHGVLLGIVSEADLKEATAEMIHEGEVILTVDLRLELPPEAETTEIAKTPTPPLVWREPPQSTPRLYDRADGVTGHFCVGRQRGSFHEFWSGTKWESFGKLITSEEIAAMLLQQDATREPARITRENELVAALRQNAIHMSWDSPGDTPIECGLWCTLCKNHVEDDRIEGHDPKCLLAVQPTSVDGPDVAQALTLLDEFTELESSWMGEVSKLQARVRAFRKNRSTEPRKS